MLNNPPWQPLGKEELYLCTTLDGSDTLFNKSLESTYHSMNGAVSESRHVFIQNGLSTQLHLPEINILEIGFGTGLNAFLTFLFSASRMKKIRYTGVDAFPIHIIIAGQLNYPEYLVAKESQDIFLKMHEMASFVTGEFEFYKFHSLDQVDSQLIYNCIYFDAFAPNDHPAIWDQSVLDMMYEKTSPGGCLVTYCAQGEVRRKMERSGFQVNRLPGAVGKREMIQAVKVGSSSPVVRGL